MALFWAWQESLEHVVGQWCNWMQNLRFKRAELTAFLCLLQTVIGLIKVHVDNKGLLDGPWRGERKCIDPKAGDAD